MALLNDTRCFYKRVKFLRIDHFVSRERKEKPVPQVWTATLLDHKVSRDKKGTTVCAVKTDVLEIP